MNSARKTTEVDSPKEAIIRDHLARNLGVLEDGLRLRDTNVEVQNPDGAVGFIDIFAEDRWGHRVVIELKRSNQAARQALNEIFKYAGLLQRHYGLRPTDFRVIVVSTTWHELLVPFSECLKDLAFSAEGFQIWVEDTGVVRHAEKIVPLPEAHLLDFIPHHVIYTFSDSRTRDGSLAGLREQLLEVGASDFVLFCLDYGGAMELPFPYAIYACLGTLPEQAIKAILAAAGVLEEVEAIKANSEEDDFEFWQRQFEQYAFGSFALDDACGEVGFPEKAEGLSREWKLGQVVRHGRWGGTDAVHTDFELWRGVARLDRGNSYFFEKRTSPRFSSEWAALPQNASEALRGYAPWESFFGPYLADIAVAFPKADVEIRIYNPCDLLVALYYVAATNDLGRVPTLCVEVWDGDQQRRSVFSSLVWDGQTCPADAEKLLAEIFAGPFGYFTQRSSGTLHRTFTRLLAAHGFSMPVLEAEWAKAPEPIVTHIAVSSCGVVRSPSAGHPAGESFLLFFQQNRDYIHSLVKFFDEHSIGL